MPKGSKPHSIVGRPARTPQPRGRCSAHHVARFTWLFLTATRLLLLCICVSPFSWTTFAQGQDTNAPAVATSQAKHAFEQAKIEHQLHPTDPEAAWHFARACFDLADEVTKSSDRADLAQLGINACIEALVKTPDSAPLHYYLALNEGQLARTKSLGALKLVDQMETEFTRAIALDPQFDYGGPDRSLGMLYRDAPAWASIGNRTKAREHMRRAVELAPVFPDNRLNLIESELKWNDRKSARQELKLLQETWGAARAKFGGAAWAASWPDWESRLEKIKRTLDEPARLESPRH